MLLTLQTQKKLDQQFGKSAPQNTNKQLIAILKKEQGVKD